MKKFLLYLLYLPVTIILPAVALHNCKKKDNSKNEPSYSQQLLINNPWDLPGNAIINSGYPGDNEEIKQ